MRPRVTSTRIRESDRGGASQPGRSEPGGGSAVLTLTILSRVEERFDVHRYPDPPIRWGGGTTRREGDRRWRTALPTTATEQDQSRDRKHDYRRTR